MIKKRKKVISFCILLSLLCLNADSQKRISISDEELPSVYFSNSTVGDGLFMLHWEIKGTFPNPTQSKFESGNFEVETSLFSAKQSEGIFWIESNTFMKCYRQLRYPIPLLQIGGYRYPSIREGFWLDEVKIEIGTDNENYVSFETEDYISSFFKDAVIGYKINEGELLPILFDGKLTRKRISLEDDTVVDIYIKGETSFGDLAKIKRITLDLRSNRMTFYKHFQFPEK